MTRSVTDNQKIQLEPLSEDPGSTISSWNGTCPESPNGQRITYFRQRDPVDEKPCDFTGEIWICDHDLTNHRKVFEMPMNCRGFEHKSGMGMWIDNRRLAFRSTGGESRTIHLLDIDSGETLHNPIAGGIGHYAVQHKVPFSITSDQQSKNPAYPAIDAPGIYTLDCDSGQVQKIVTSEEVFGFVRSRGYTPKEKNFNISHVMFNFDMSRLMWRLDFMECQGIISCNADGGELVIFPNKPLHQLWFDNQTYFAADRKAQRISRWQQDGELLEILAGAGNHIDASPDREWYITDSAYHQTPITISLYRRGQVIPAAELDRHDFAYSVWKLGAHANPVFSRDGKRVYFNRPVEETKVQVVCAEIKPLLS